MPTAPQKGISQEVFLIDALPAGTAEIGAAVRSRDGETAVTLLASGVRTADGTGADVTDASLQRAAALVAVLDVTAQSGTTPTLDVEIQAKFGSFYTPLLRWSQYGAATGAKGVTVKRDLAFATEMTLAADPAASTGLLVNDHDWLDTLRAKWLIAGGTPSYTFSVTIYPIR